MNICDQGEPIEWQLDFKAIMPDGAELEGVEGEGSWFLVDQTGRVWEYGPMKIPTLINKAYVKAIPRLKIGDKYMTMAEIKRALNA